MVLKNDLRYMKTEDAFKTAFLELLEEMPKDKISISKICERARCSRPAFYNHFLDKEDLYSSIIKDFVELLHDVALRNHADPNNPKGDSKESSAEFFDTFMANRALILTLLKGDRATVQHQLTKQLRETYILEALEISGQNKVDPAYEWIASYGAGGNIAFMLDCLTAPNIDLSKARQVYIDLQSPVSEFAVNKYLE